MGRSLEFDPLSQISVRLTINMTLSISQIQVSKYYPSISLFDVAKMNAIPKKSIRNLWRIWNRESVKAEFSSAV